MDDGGTGMTGAGWGRDGDRYRRMGKGQTFGCGMGWAGNKMSPCHSVLYSQQQPVTVAYTV